jgi:hypothetical protein
MNLMKETKTLIVTETLRYEFTVPASMPENDDALKRFFARHPDPWSEADFAAVVERDFEIEGERSSQLVLEAGQETIMA